MKILLASVTLLIMTISSNAAVVTKQSAGKMPDGSPLDLYILKDGSMEVHITNYGAIVQAIKVPDRKGNVADVVLGFDTPEEYVKTGNPPYFGAMIGRYANRIAHGQFKLDGKTYEVPKNDGDNALHGGKIGFDKKLWTGKQIPNGVELTLVSPNDDQGFPGTLTTVVRYTLEGKELRIDISATTDAHTVLNLTNHSYFNLKGQGSGDILKHEAMINADRYTPVDANLIPTGELAPVKGTPFDFLKATEIGKRIDDNNEQLKLGLGYDHNFVLNSGGKKYDIAAYVYEPTSGRVLEAFTDQPGVQFYTGNHLNGKVAGKGGVVYQKRDAFCLETQHFPDSPNHPNFPTTELKPGEKFHAVTVYRFSTR